jgi:trk system potassium uptake protein TrkA
MKSFVVIGLGRFGARVAQRLCQQGGDVLAMDLREEAVQSLADEVTQAVMADATNREVLQSLDVQSCDCAIVAIGSDLAAAVLTTMNLKSLNVPKIICKAHDAACVEVLKRLGADEVIIPEEMIADKLAGRLVSPNVLEYIELSQDYSIVELAVPRPWVGKTILEMNVRTKYEVNILAIKQGEDILVSPRAQQCMNGGDTLVLLGAAPALERVQKLGN